MESNLAIWPQITMIVITTLTWVGSVKRDTKENGESTLVLWVFGHAIGRGLFILLLYYGGFWKSLGWAP